MLVFPRKQIRAVVIADYIRAAGYPGCICFSCGNASKALKDTGLEVVDISPIGDLQPTSKWWLPEEVYKVWPHLFDATSGHLPAFLMIRIAEAFKKQLGDLTGRIEVPTGSGETIQCLRWAYPKVEFVPMFNCGPGTQKDEQAPLLGIVCNG